jgi:hypothetical protein
VWLDGGVLPRRRALAPAVAALVGLALAPALSGCSRAVAVEAAPQGWSKACAEVYTALPDGVAGLDRRETTAQGAAAWSGGADGEVVVLRCGVEPLDALETAGGCTAVESPGGGTVDWIPGEPLDGRVIWTTYGRTPAVALEMPADEAVTSSATIDVAPAVALVEKDRSCS